MNTKWKTLAGIAVFLVFLGAASFAYSLLTKNHRPGTAVSPGSSPSADSVTTAASGTQSAASTVSSAAQSEDRSAPDFTVWDTQGQPVKLSDFSGKPVVLNFWASWCPPCKSEMPHFDEVYASYENDVVFLMVDLTDGQRETQTTAANYVRKQGYRFPVYFDRKLSAADAYNILAIPDTFFIDAEGNVVQAYEGAIDKDTLIAGIQAIQK